jgi:hypothetical protein
METVTFPVDSGEEVVESIGTILESEIPNARKQIAVGGPCSTGAS